MNFEKAGPLASWRPALISITLKDGSPGTLWNRWPPSLARTLDDGITGSRIVLGLGERPRPTVGLHVRISTALTLVNDYTIGC